MSSPPDATSWIPEGSKYALLALPDPNTRGSLAPITDLGDGYYFGYELPGRIPDHWREWIGSLELRRVEQARFYLLARAPSAQPEVLDDENEALVRRVYRLYLGLLIAVPYFRHGEIICLSGANVGGELQVRQRSRYLPVFNSIGSPHAEITVPKLRDAAALATAIAKVADGGLSDRIRRILRAFTAGCNASPLDERLHQFVRAAEGIIDADFKNGAKIFAHRGQEITFGNFQNDYREMYVIRSSTEHLRGPLARIKAPSAERETIMRHRTIQAETLARFCLWYFLGSERLWPHFRDDSTIEAYWQLPHSQRRKLWTSRVDMAGALREFNDNVAKWS